MDDWWYCTCNSLSFSKEPGATIEVAVGDVTVLLPRHGGPFRKFYLSLVQSAFTISSYVVIISPLLVQVKNGWELCNVVAPCRDSFFDSEPEQTFMRWLLMLHLKKLFQKLYFWPKFYIVHK
jgi:hypothetical protein